MCRQSPRKLFHTETIGNRVQHYYKANSRAFLDDVEWRKVPDSLKEGLRATLLSNVIDDSVEALVEGIFDSFDASHLSWTPLIVMEQARAETGSEKRVGPPTKAKDLVAPAKSKAAKASKAKTRTRKAKTTSRPKRHRNAGK